VKLAVVVGTRPEIVKMAPVIRAAGARHLDLRVLHTGQHYSFELDRVFFDELELPAPDANLNVGSASAPAQVAAIVSGVGEWIARERPDWLLVEGDTNSVLGAALAAHKSGVRLGHVEAGLRSFDRTMPEETNRILTDHMADLLFAPTAHASRQLASEGVEAARVRVTGNTVVDELLRQRERAMALGAAGKHGLAPGGYLLATVHRAENTDVPERLAGIMAGLGRAARALAKPVLCALHPRTRARLESLRIAFPEGVRALPPLPYLEFLGLQADAALVLTDSGGLQEEACVLGVPCVTMRDNTERPESIEVRANRLAGASADRIERAAVEMAEASRAWVQPFGDGHAAERIVEALGGLTDHARACAP
jgi:UDP-N-acetylglucosamine 2-epimerase (non-hydrolysing)